ncbi:MAG: DUF971 domain-containing protein [Bacteroidota bacterium]|nr:DUF971 domain-containing protein [Candidatus Kapabacteria bacterium]MDW8220182.1 DUF971 domain-containing protein [Bacteroidota bacterium]
MPSTVPTPLRITRPQPYLLSVLWSDGVSTIITLRSLRDNCPCAACQGENIMGTTYSFGMSIVQPGMYELTGIHPVGNYAIQVSWKDGHATGIYSWDILRNICMEHHLSEEALKALEAQAQQEGLTSKQ